MKRTLSLKRETLTALDADELAGVAGAAEWTFPQCQVELTKKIVATLLSPLPTDPCS